MRRGIWKKISPRKAYGYISSTTRTSAADIEKALSGIQYPKAKKGLVQYTSQNVSTIDQELFDLIKSLPERTYRDSAKVATALGD